MTHSRLIVADTQVLDGLFSLTSRLFGVTIEAADGQAEVWNSDVRFFNVRSTDKEVIAQFFLDPYSRPKEKNGGAWMNTCVDRSRLLGPKEKGGKRIPVAYIICNQSPPVGETPSLMTFREVETIFHEFGHGLQHMLTQMEYGDVAGINGIEWDAVEIPSQMMENFCYDKSPLNTALRYLVDIRTNLSILLASFIPTDTIAAISGHYKTGSRCPTSCSRSSRRRATTWWPRACCVSWASARWTCTCTRTTRRRRSRCSQRSSACWASTPC